MSNRIHALAQQLTGNQNLEDCSLEEVKQIAQRYPYFAPAQFLLLQKLRQSGNAEEADAQYKKAVLFYPDPLQFEFFISSSKFYEEATEASQNETASLFPFEEEIENDADTTNEEPTTTAVEISSAPSEEETEKSPDVPLTETSEDLVQEYVHEEVKEPEEPQEKIIAAQEAPVTVSETEIVQSTIEENGESLQTSPPLVFEPYHTVDYFASQGIKISGDDLPKDKLGKGLKSFTEWLKTMKRLPTAQLAESSESTAEKGVETLANRSVSDSEVLTEAMAEVWVKQGAPQKALDIYNKLLLHDPSKKAYFAAKIENLKQS